MQAKSKNPDSAGEGKALDGAIVPKEVARVRRECAMSSFVSPIVMMRKRIIISFASCPTRTVKVRICMMPPLVLEVDCLFRFSFFFRSGRFSNPPCKDWSSLYRYAMMFRYAFTEPTATATDVYLHLNDVHHIVLLSCLVRNT